MTGCPETPEPSHGPKKTNRPHAYPPELRAKWVAHAALVSIEDAARKFGVNHQTIRNHMRAAGIKPRRPGNFTRHETSTHPSQ